MAEGGVSLPGEVYEMPIHHHPVFGGAYGELAFPEAEQITVAAAIEEAAEAALLRR